MYSQSVITVHTAHPKKHRLKQWKTHGDIWEPTPELSQGDADWIHSGESVLHHIIVNLSPNNRADHISQPEAQEPLWVRWHPVPIFLLGGSGVLNTIYWCWHFASRHLLPLPQIRIQSLRASLKPQKARAAATISPRGLECWLYNIEFTLNHDN